MNILERSIIMLIDLTDPADKAVSILAEQPGNTGVAAVYEISSFRTMSIDEFKEKIVPELHKSPASDSFFYYVLRDLSHNRVFSLYPDGVLEYKVDGLREVPTEVLVEQLCKSNGDSNSIKDYIVNSSFPLWSYGENNSFWRMAVKIPETRFQFRHPRMFIKDEDFPWIYLPPCVYTVTARKGSNTVADTNIKLLLQDSMAPEKCVFAHMPLPNIYPDGNICMGSTAITDSYDPSTWSKSRVVSTVFDLFINTNWNYDLLHTCDMPENLNAVFEELYPGECAPERLHSDIAIELWKIVKILQKEGAWEKLNFIRM